MTDLERWRAFADAAGVAYREDPGRTYWQHERDEPSLFLFVGADEGGKNAGYSGFFATLVFTLEGELVQFGVWE